MATAIIFTKPFFEGLRNSIQEEHVLGVIDHSFGLAQQLTDTVSNIATIFKQMVAYIPKIPISIYQESARFINSLSFLQLISFTSLIAGCLSLFLEGAAMYHQYQTAGCIETLPPNLTEPQKEEILQTAKQLFKQLPFHQLRKTLPDYLQKELHFDTVNTLHQDAASHIETRLQNLQFTDLDKIKTSAKKKMLLHQLGALAAVISTVCAVGMIVAWPATVLTVLTVCSVGIAVGIYVLKKSWLENREGGIDLRRLIPFQIHPISLKEESSLITVKGLKEARKTDLLITLTLHHRF
ncbi:MAG: hypothetical protein QRY72_01280 [Candidatus Rhabdochlamydia sp.]